MVNNYPEQPNEQFWYPRLPDGYDGSDQAKHSGPIPMPSTNTSEHFAGYAGQSYGMPGSGFTAYNPTHVAQGFTSGHGGSTQGWPGFPSGQGSLAQGWPGFPSGQGGPSQGWPGFPSGQGGPSQGWPGFPGQGGPSQGWPGFPGPGFQPGPSAGNQAPQTAPPDWTPEYPSHQLFAVDPGAIRRCMFRFTYVWLSRRQGFWFYPVFVGRNSVAGYRWNSRRRRWEYIGLDLENINSFTCV